jgi:hypothetical protein
VYNPSSHHQARYEGCIDEALEPPGQLLRYESGIDGRMSSVVRWTITCCTKVVSMRRLWWDSIGGLSRFERCIVTDVGFRGMTVLV